MVIQIHLTKIHKLEHVAYMNTELDLSFEQMYNVLYEVAKPGWSSQNSVSLISVFNVTDELNFYGHASRILDSMNPLGSPLRRLMFRIKFNGPEMKTLFLLKFGQYLK